jgi:hypothetical protein
LKRCFFSIGQIRRFDRLLERADEILRQAIVECRLIAHRHAATALIVKSDPQPHQLQQTLPKRKGLRHRCTESKERLRDFWGIRIDAEDRPLNWRNQIGLHEFAKLIVPFLYGN